MINKEFNISVLNYIIIDPPLDTLNKGIIDFKKLPRVSFCIPTLNNENTLDNCLASIVSQDYPDIEIIIVDGNSNDRTIEIAKKYTNKIYFNSGLLGSARQMSVEKSTGQVLALFDSDIILPHKEWLANAVKYFNFSDNVSTIWPINVAPPLSSITTKFYFNQWKLIMDHRIKNGKSVYGGGNALILRKCIDEIGGINTSLHWGEDFDWAKKLKHKGYQVIYIHDPIYHDTMRDLSEFAKKQFVGANTFASSGFALMNLSFSDIFYEQILLSGRGMFVGLIKYKDRSWLVFPFYLFIRLAAYSLTYLKKVLKSGE